MPTDPGGGPDPADSAVAVRWRVRHDHAVFSFNGLADGRDLAFGLGDKAGAFGPGDRHVQVRLVRPHSECLTGDVFGSERCDCGPQMREAVERIAESGGSCCTYGRRVAASGLSAKLEAYALQDDGLDTYEANRAPGHGKDERTYASAAAQMMQTGLSGWHC